ncbi:MAG: glycosyltransferase family 2 protein [Candidatus Hydrogenedentes bacterium]|nr:glycosyltransferase family 2 protein [Candidatus Hydrogenedentota bacterium]
MTIRLSLIIPAYNEAQRLPGTLRQVHAYLAAQSYASEIVVVDDGSTDATALAAQTTMEELGAGPVGFACVRLERNRGKGAAVRQGMLHEARGAYRFFYDADGATPIEEIEGAMALFESGAEIVIGSRALAASRVEVHQAWYREHMGQVNNVFLRLLGLTPYKDTQCGFKGFSARAVEIVFPRQTIEGFAFDVELLYIAWLHGLRIEELPVTWRNSPRSTLNPVSDSLAMIWESWTVRFKAFLGSYR